MAQKKETSDKSAKADAEKPSSKSVTAESAKTAKPAAKATAEKKSVVKVSSKQAQQPEASPEDSAKVSSSVPTTPKKSASKTAAAKAEAAPKTKAAAAKEESEVKTPAAKAPAVKAEKAEKVAKPRVASLVPAELPKVKKPVVAEAAPELVIKQVYNPAKMPPFIKKQQQRLIELRSSLMDSMDGVAKEVLRARPEGSDGSVGGMHMGDAGSDAYDRDFALSMLSKEQDALYEINEALIRVDAGVYGVCELSGLKIVEERLEALPYTRYTREMQEQIERDQMGGRFTRPVVRSVFGLEDDGDEDDEDDEDGNTSSSNNNNDSSLDFSKE